MIVTSVPHSGTHFVVYELLKDYTDVRDDDFKAGLWKYQSHTYSNAMDELKRLLSQGHPCIVPVRHPVLVAQSWKRRGKEPLESIPFWSRLINEIHQYHPFYIPIDMMYARDAALSVINQRLKIKLETDWPIVRDSGPRDTKILLSKKEESEILGFMDEEPRFFEEFHYHY